MTLGTLRGVLGRIVDLRREDLRRVLPLAASLGAVLASLYTLKPARNALFLNRLGIDQLPVALMMVAVVGAVVTSLFGKLAPLLSIRRLLTRTVLILLASLIAFRFLLRSGEPWVFHAFFIWVNLYGLIGVSLIWLYANAVFDPHEARRLFGFVGTGGIAGAIAGGFLTGRIADRVGTENLLLVSASLLTVALVLALLVPTADTGRRKSKRQEEVRGTFRLVLESDLLRRIGIMAGLISLVSVVVDIQFNEIVSREFPSKDEKTAFFGNFFGYLNGLAFLFQVLIAPRILKSLGVVAALSFLPIGLALGSAVFMVVPAIWSVTLAKAGDSGFRHSIHKSATEILFLPVPSDVKQRTKLFLDATVDAVASGSGALLVMVLTRLGLPYPYLSLLSLALIVAWIAVILRLRSAYVDSFRKALERREIDLRELRTDVVEAATIDHLVDALKSGNERQVAYGLDVLGAVRSSALIAPLRALLSHHSPEIRRKAVRLLERNPSSELLPEMERLIGADPDLEVRAAAMAYAASHDPANNGLLRLEGYVRSEDPAVRSAAIRCIAERGGGAEKKLLGREVVDACLSDSRPEAQEARVEMTRALGVLDDPELRGRLLQLREDPSPEIVRAAIEAAGRSQDQEMVPWLLSKLRERRFRSDARNALVSFGMKVLPTLIEHLGNASVDASLRRQIPRVLAEIPDQRTVNALLLELERSDPALDLAVIKALNKLRSHYPSLGFDRARVNAALRREAESFHQLLQIEEVLERSDAPARSPLWLTRRAAKEKLARRLELIFRLLALRYPPRDIYNAYQGMISTSASLRGSALELLENVLRPATRELLLPLLDPSAKPAAIARGLELFGGTRVTDLPDALERMIKRGDPWLQACSIFALGAVRGSRVLELIEDTGEHGEEMVREAIRAVREKKRVESSA